MKARATSGATTNRRPNAKGLTAAWDSLGASVRSGAALPWLLLAVFYVFTLTELRRAYLSKGFNYHDLGLISDFMASTWHARGFFHVFDAGINHLGWLFTPTMILFTPLHAVCNSQFTLIFWLTTAAFGGYAFLLATIRLLLERSGASGRGETPWPWVGSLFALFAGISTYAWKVNTSVHYESLYLLLASALMFFLVKGARWRTLVLLYLLTLGTRPDAGLFLALQLATALALPTALLPAARARTCARRALASRVALLAAGGLLYAIVVVKLISPAFGIGENTHAVRLWSHYGESYGAVAMHVLTHPGTLWDSLRGGAFLKLNQSLLLLPLLHPAGWISNLAGFIFYTTDDSSHRLLEFYNSALLMPGLFVGAFAGLIAMLEGLSRFVAAVTRAKGAPAGLRAITLALLVVIAAVGAGFGGALQSFRALTDETHSGGVAPEEGKRQIAWIRWLLNDCPAIHSVAADFQTSTFLPNRVGIALLKNAEKADAVVFAPNATPFLSGAGSLAEFERTLHKGRLFAPLGEAAGLKAFVRPGLCKRSG